MCSKERRNPYCLKIEVYIPEKGGAKASSRQTSVSFSGGRRGTRHVVGSLRGSGAADAGGICNGVWDKFGMKEVVKCDTLYVGVGHHHSQGKGMCLSHAGRHAYYGSWKATSALAKGKYRLSSSGGIPRARSARRKTFSIVSIAARRAREYSVRLKRSSYVFCYIWSV